MGPIFIVFGLTRPGIEPQPPSLRADALLGSVAKNVWETTALLNTIGVHTGHTETVRGKETISLRHYCNRLTRICNLIAWQQMPRHKLVGLLFLCVYVCVCVCLAEIIPGDKP